MNRLPTVLAEELWTRGVSWRIQPRFEDDDPPWFAAGQAGESCVGTIDGEFKIVLRPMTRLLTTLVMTGAGAWWSGLRRGQPPRVHPIVG